MAKDIFGKEIKISEYKFCDYTDNKYNYIFLFYLLDAEKLGKIYTFHNANPERKAQIICSSEISKIIKEIEPYSNITTIEIEDYIERQMKIYEKENDIKYIDSSYTSLKYNT